MNAESSEKLIDIFVCCYFPLIYFSLTFQRFADYADSARTGTFALRKWPCCGRITLRTSKWAIGAAGAQVLYTHKVGGSNPSSPTISVINSLIRVTLFAPAQVYFFSSKKEQD